MKKIVYIAVISAISILLSGCNNNDSTASTVNVTAANSIELSTYEMSDLNDSQKYSLAYMWNEEKLAKEIYLAFNELYPLTTFTKIANNAETRHMQLVEDLVQRYDLNISNLVDYKENYSEAELRALEPGVYGVPEIQDLYNTLYTMGDDSLIDALKVACMVEVTDINDLDVDIALAGDVMDLVDTFTILRDGSYNHYWGFDSALKAQGVADGCCSIGEIDGVEYCKNETEYPKKTR